MMRFGRYLLIIFFLGILITSCGPGYRIGEQKIKKIKNIHDVNVIKKSRLKYTLEKERTKALYKQNKKRWKSQMKNRYKY